MKKKIIITLIVCVLLICCVGCTSKSFDLVPSPLTSNPQFSKETLGKKGLEYMKIFAEQYSNRTAGDGADNIFAKYLSQEMLKFGYVGKKGNDQSQVEGITTFTFNPSVNANTLTSYNAIFDKKVNNSKGKIVFTTYYDNCYAIGNDNQMKSDGSYESGASLAVMLTLAENFAKLDNLQYDLTFAFFGAGAYGYLGAIDYYSSLSNQDKNDISLLIDFGQIVGGDYTYAYSRDKSVDYNSLVYQTATTNNIGLKPIPVDKRIASGLLYQDFAYPYFHIGMMGNHTRFMSDKVPTIHYLSANWSSNENPSVTEMTKKENIYQTSADTLENMTSRVGGYSKLEERIGDIIQLNYLLLAENSYASDFDQAIKIAREQDVNLAWVNPKLVGILGIVISIILIGIMIAISMSCKQKVMANKDKYKVVRSVPLEEQMKKMQNGEPFNSEDIKNIFGDEFGGNTNEEQQKSNDDSPKNNESDVFDDF